MLSASRAAGASGLALAVAGILFFAPDRIAGAPLAVAITAAVLFLWRSGIPGRLRAGDVAILAALGLSLGAGFVLVLAGGAPGGGPGGLPWSTWGLLCGFWLAPLVLTSAGFALTFEPSDRPAPADGPGASERGRTTGRGNDRA